MPELSEPVPEAWRRVLRRAVRDHALGEHRRRHLPLLHVGRPGAAEAVVPAVADDTASDDHALRVDVLAALLSRVAGPGDDSSHEGDGEPAPLVWLTRTGALDLQDVDARWLAAARAASAEAAVDLTMVVVNRHGWRDPRTGAEQRWKRIRRG